MAAILAPWVQKYQGWIELVSRREQSRMGGGRAVLRNLCFFLDTYVRRAYPRCPRVGSLQGERDRWCQRATWQHPRCVRSEECSRDGSEGLWVRQKRPAVVLVRIVNFFLLLRNGVTIDQMGPGGCVVRCVALAFTSPDETVSDGTLS